MEGRKVKERKGRSLYEGKGGRQGEGGHERIRRWTRGMEEGGEWGQIRIVVLKILVRLLVRAPSQPVCALITYVGYIYIT